VSGQTRIGEKKGGSICAHANGGGDLLWLDGQRARKATRGLAAYRSHEARVGKGLHISCEKPPLGLWVTVFIKGKHLLRLSRGGS